MPIYMDVHILPGVKAENVAEAHQRDLLHQEEYGCKCMTYWIDEKRESVFCLVEAPSRQAVEEMHSKAHGLIPNKVIEVDSALVESFLGRIYDPEKAQVTPDGLKVFTDPSFRILLVTQMTDPHLVKHQLGIKKTEELMFQHNAVIRRNLAQHHGREAEQEGRNFVASFTAASSALACALSIQEEMRGVLLPGTEFRMAIHAGEPVEKSSRLFGDTVLFAFNLCGIAKNAAIAITATVRDLVAKDFFQNKRKNLLCLSVQDEHLLKLLFGKLEENWHDAGFDVGNFCKVATMSSSQLYRKTVALTGLSPNLLLKDFRLEKAKELMHQQRDSIAQITYGCGFTSASYFTKCFKRKYGLLPMAYLDMLR